MTAPGHAPHDPHPMTPGQKPPTDRLYGRIRGHSLRPRQQALLEITLPRLRIPLAAAATPHALFPVPTTRLAVEIGFGGGEHARALAQSDPALGIIACEIYDSGIASLLSALLPKGTDPASAPLPPNLRLWDDDARPLLRALPPACLDLVVLMFPDPWPKARHARRRFLHPGQLALVARLLPQGATWRVATDDPTYQAWVTEVMAAQTLFDAPAPVTVRPGGWPPTRYEAKALRAGRTPLYWSFARTATPAPAVEPETRWTPAPV